MIAIDSIFSPIKRVNFHVENARVGRMTDYDKLTLEIWTDGTISPRDALSNAAGILREHLDIFINPEERADAKPASGIEETPYEVNKNLYRSVNELELICPGRQLLEKRQYQDHRGSRSKNRDGDAEDEELWKEIPERN